MNINLERLLFLIKESDDKKPVPKPEIDFSNARLVKSQPQSLGNIDPYKNSIPPEHYKGVAAKPLWTYDRFRHNVGSAIRDVPGVGSLYAGAVGTPEPGQTGWQAIKANRGHIFETVANYMLAEHALDRAAFGKYWAPNTVSPAGTTTSWRHGLGRGTGFLSVPAKASNPLVRAGSGEIASNIARRWAPKAVAPVAGMAASGLGRASGALGGPWFVPISAGFEGVDILRHGYDLNRFRNLVRPDNTVLGVQSTPFLSYAGSSLNASMNPIRSAHLLAKDTNDLINGEYSVKKVNDANTETNERVQDNVEKMRARLDNKVRAFGYDSLSDAERRDRRTWHTPNYGRSEAVNVLRSIFN